MPRENQAGLIWIASLRNSDGEIVGEMVIRDPELIDQALHGNWSVVEYVYVGPVEAYAPRSEASA